MFSFPRNAVQVLVWSAVSLAAGWRERAAPRPGLGRDGGRDGGGDAGSRQTPSQDRAEGNAGPQMVLGASV